MNSDHEAEKLSPSMSCEVWRESPEKFCFLS
nr:MAG TPA: hypothetical protein [Caudoviricetes sp.]